MEKNKYSILWITICGVIATLVIFSLGYYLGRDNSKNATVVSSVKDGVAFEDPAKKIDNEENKECFFTINPGNNNEAKTLLIDKLKLVDIDSYEVVGTKLFYATGPIYGKPEIGIIDCISSVKTTIIFPEHKQSNYPYGSDYFRIKKVSKKLTSNSYNIQYYYASDVDKIDFNKFENDNNLKIFIFKIE
jgi:hypothetical protein